MRNVVKRGLCYDSHYAWATGGPIRRNVLYTDTLVPGRYGGNEGRQDQPPGRKIELIHALPPHTSFPWWSIAAPTNYRALCSDLLVIRRAELALSLPAVTARSATGSLSTLSPPSPCPSSHRCCIDLFHLRRFSRRTTAVPSSNGLIQTTS